MKKKKEKTIAVMFAAVFCTAALLAAGCRPAAAQTGIASTTNYNDLPVNHVKVERLSMDSAVFSSTNSDIIMTSNWQVADSSGGATTKAIMYNGTVNWGTANTTQTANAKTAKNTVPGSFTLRWADAATLPDGTKADVVYTFSNWEFNIGERPSGIAETAKVNVPILQGTGSVSYTTSNPRRGTANTTAVATTIKQSITTNVKVVKHGTDSVIDTAYSSMMIRFLDLDVIDHSVAIGSSAAERFAGSYSEGIAFVSGWKSPIYRTADTSTVLETVGSNQKVRGTKAADGTIASGFIASASPQGYSYIWYGSYSASGADGATSMATGLSVGPEVSVFASAGQGGSIEKPGVTNYILNARTTYDYTPGRGYKVKSLTVNGSPASFDAGGGTYTFAKLIERSSSYDHTIDVKFKGPSVSYRWEGDHPDMKLPDGGEITPGDYEVDGTYRKGDGVRAENVTTGGKTYPRGTWIFEGWDKEGMIEVWDDTVITGRWVFRPEWNITAEAVNGKADGAEENIPDGENRTVMYTPDEGYQLKTLEVDGEEQDIAANPEGYSFSGIDRDHSVRAVFEMIPKLEIEKKADRRHYNAGDIVTYTVSVRQTAIGAEARGVIVTDSIPEGLSLIEGSIEGPGVTVEEESESAYRLSIGAIGSDAEAELPGEVIYTYRCKAKDDIDAHGLENTVTAGGRNVPGQVTDSAAVDAHVPLVTIEKLVDRERAAPGDTLEYTIKVRQTHDGAELRNVILVDTIPEGITVDEASIIVTRAAGDDAPDADDEKGSEAAGGDGAGEDEAEPAGSSAGDEGAAGDQGAAENQSTADDQNGAEEEGVKAAEGEDGAGGESGADGAGQDGEAPADEKAEEADPESAPEDKDEADEPVKAAAEDSDEGGAEESGAADEMTEPEEEPAGDGGADDAEDGADRDDGDGTDPAAEEPQVRIEDGKIIVESAVMKKGFNVSFRAKIDEGTEGEVVNVASVDGYITDEQKLPEPLESTAVTLVKAPKEKTPAAVVKRELEQDDPAEPEAKKYHEEKKGSSGKPVRTGDDSFPAAALVIMAAALAAGAGALAAGRRKRSTK